MIEKVVVVLLSKFPIDISEKKQRTLIEFVRFLVIGVTNVFVSYVLNIITLILLFPLHLTWDYIIGNIVSFLLSVLWSFYWNNKYVFKQEEKEKRNPLLILLKTYVSYSFSCIILNNMFSWFFIIILGISKFVSPLIVSCVTMPINFLLNKFWTYRISS